MNLELLLKQKMEEKQKMEAELQKLDEYRLKVMSLSLKLTGAVDLLSAIVDQQKKESATVVNSDEKPGDPQIVDSVPLNTPPA